MFTDLVAAILVGVTLLMAVAALVVTFFISKSKRAWTGGASLLLLAVAVQNWPLATGLESDLWFKWAVLLYGVGLLTWLVALVAANRQRETE